MLNTGLLATALGHVAILGPMLVAGQGGPMLPWVAGAWGAAAAASGTGLLSGGETVAKRS